jgi:hypothetical protein
MKQGTNPQRVTCKGNKRDVLAIHPGTAQPIRTTALQNSSMSDNI